MRDIAPRVDARARRLADSGLTNHDQLNFTSGQVDVAANITSGSANGLNGANTGNASVVMQGVPA